MPWSKVSKALIRSKNISPVNVFVNVFQQSVCHVCEAQSMRLSPVSLQNIRLLGTKNSLGTILLNFIWSRLCFN